jgi:hypothetical protein
MGLIGNIAAFADIKISNLETTKAARRREA